MRTISLIVPAETRCDLHGFRVSAVNLAQAVDNSPSN